MSDLCGECCVCGTLLVICPSSGYMCMCPSWDMCMYITSHLSLPPRPVLFTLVSEPLGLGCLLYGTLV